MEMSDELVARVVREFEGVDLGDPRRSQRALKIVAAMAKRPQDSLPASLGTDAELEGAYRLLNNENVDYDDLLVEHRDRTIERAEQAGEVLVVHDTTTCTFEHGDPKEIGYLPTGKAGFLVHTSLVVDACRHRRPLGVLHIEPLWRNQRSGRGSRKKKVSGAEAASWNNRESERWARCVQECAEHLEGCSVVHVMDREADKYELCSHMLQHGQRFVVRARHNRRLAATEDAEFLQDVLEKAPIVAGRDVYLSRREGSTAPRAKSLMPQRLARAAKLSFSAAAVTLRRPRNVAESHPACLSVNVVLVRESDPPKGQPPVNWVLLTSEPVDTREQMERIIDIYRYRWLIEEFFKALKTGCIYEERLFESRHALLNLLATSLPIAVELLWMRSRVADAPEAPAADIVTPDELHVLRTMGHRPLPATPTAGQVLLAIAGLGGHLKRNGSPGWQVLKRGYQRLLDYTAGWTAAQKRGRPSAKKKRRNL
jgi:hypothetical protein